MIADFLPERIGKLIEILGDAEAAIPIADLDSCQLLWVWHRETAQADRVEELENCSVCSHAESQCPNRRESERRALSQRAQRETDISNGRFRPSRTASV